LHKAPANLTNFGLPKECDMGSQENILKDSRGFWIRWINPQK